MKECLFSVGSVPLSKGKISPLNYRSGVTFARYSHTHISCQVRSLGSTASKFYLGLELLEYCSNYVNKDPYPVPVGPRISAHCCQHATLFLLLVSPLQIFRRYSDLMLLLNISLADLL